MKFTVVKKYMKYFYSLDTSNAFEQSIKKLRVSKQI